MKPHYTAALLGLGRIAWRFDAASVEGPARTHFGSFQREGRVRVIGGFSPNVRERVEFQSTHNLPAFQRQEDVLAAQPDIVSICSPSEFHYDQTLACLEQEIPMVWLEKPPTLTLEQLETLMQHAAYRTGTTKVLVNYMRRYSPIYAQLRRVYEKRLLGQPVAMQVLYSRGLELNGSHFLDTVFWIIGDRALKEVAISDAERRKSNPTFLLRFDDDFVVSLCGHETQYHINDIVLVCETGRASILSGGMQTRLEVKSANERHAGFYRLKPTESELLKPKQPENLFSAALTDLINAHEKGGQPLSNLTTARQTQTIMEQIRR